MKTPLFVMVCIAFVSLAETVCAQEVQVPLDAEGELEVVGKKLERDLRLFPGYAGFKEARLFQVSGDSFALEIYYRREGRLFKQRLLLSPGKIDSLRREVSAKIQMLRPSSLQDRSGRTRFLARTFLLSYGFYSWAIPVSLDLRGSPAQVTALLAGSAGFFAPFSISGKISVSQTAASFSGHLGTTGIAHGILLSELLFGKNNSRRRILALGTTGSLSGLVGGFVLGQRSSMTAGTAEVIGWGGNYGLLMTLGAAHLVGFLDEDHRREVALSALLGSGLGYWGGQTLTRQHPYTRGDSGVLVATTFLGTYLSVTLLNLTDTEKPKAYTTAAMTGSAISIGLGHRLLRDKNFSTGESWMIGLGGFAGYLLGGAVNNTLGGDSSQAWLSLTSLGALGGFWFTYRTFVEEAQIDDREVSWDIHFSPQLLLPRVALQSGRFSSASFPLLTIACRFP